MLETHRDVQPEYSKPSNREVKKSEVWRKSRVQSIRYIRWGVDSVFFLAFHFEYASPSATSDRLSFKARSIRSVI